MLQPKIIRHNQSSVTLYPDRGGIITSIRFGDTELLYQGMLDSTLHDMTKSVRGGIPILFPNAGFLTDDEKEKSGYSLPQHGFARTNEWKVTDESNDSLTQSFSSSDVPDTFGYDWQGSIENMISLKEYTVQLRYSIANSSDKELPISFGLHPYWAVPLGDKSQIVWNFAGGDIIARDIVNWSSGGTTRIDMPPDGIVRVTIPGIGNLELHVSPDFRRLWIWSLSDQDFVCIEPMMGDDGHIIKNPTRIPVGGKSESWVRINII